VAKGQLLAVVFDENLQHAYDKAMADVAVERARADEARAACTRTVSPMPPRHPVERGRT
jgi:hypothetical protein